MNVEQPASQSWLQIRAHFAGLARTRMATTRAIVLGALLVWAALTPSFLSAPSLTALLTTAQGAGAVLGALSLAPLAYRLGSGRVLAGSLILIPVALIGYSTSQTPWWGATALFAVGLVYIGVLSGL